MNPSIGEQIMEYLFTLFTANVTGCTVYRSRQAALALSEGNALLIEPSSEAVERKSAYSLMKRDFVLRTMILVRGDIPDQVADGIRVPMHAAMMQDQTLGGLSLSIVEESTEWTYEEADQTAVNVEGRYRIIFATPANSLTSSA
jgi:hypothetical protein